MTTAKIDLEAMAASCRKPGRGPRGVSLRLFAVAVAVAFALGCNKKCDTHVECLGHGAGNQGERCAPRIDFCRGGLCVSECGVPHCAVLNFYENPCDEDWLCNDQSPAGPYCTPQLVSCEQPADCPSYLPSEEGEWTCEEGTCRFPGYCYPDEDCE